MKQILQDLSKGKTYIEEAPAPAGCEGTLLIQTEMSLISAGTERMLVDFGRSSLIQKARQQPEKVKMVLDKALTDGIATTLSAVRSKLAQPIPLGYCNVGTVIEVGNGVKGFKKGYRVLSNGPHADIVRVPVNLCAKVPDDVSSEAAAFGVAGSIALQGIRIAKPTLGESFVVTGVGLIGLLAVQLLRAHGCRVLAIDFDANKLELARSFGAETCNPGASEDPIASGINFSRERGVDGVIVTASTASSDPISQAARMSRKRGRIVLVGVTGLELNRADFYEKELSFQVSCSYGPGRYDSEYEEKGHDYPIGFVRWTTQRNFEAVLDMMSSGRLDVSPLITHRIDFEKAPDAYDILTKDKTALGLLLCYPPLAESALKRNIPMARANGEAQPTNKSDGNCAFVGAGNYASRVLMPAFRKAGANLHTVVTSTGISGVIHGKNNGAEFASTNIDDVLDNKTIDTVVIATRHNTHAHLTQKALAAGKHVFVEKPLAITEAELESLEITLDLSSKATETPLLMIGFNRRFSPHSQKIKALLAPIKEPKAIIATINAGAIPSDHWTQDPKIGGGRIIGEACHFIDLMRFYTGSKIVSIQARQAVRRSSSNAQGDVATITLGFEDGSTGTVHYLANGATVFPKERIEIFCAGRILQLDNFRKLRAFGWDGFKKLNLWSQNKGQVECAQHFIAAIKNGSPSPIPLDEILEVTRSSINAAKALDEQER